MLKLLNNIAISAFIMLLSSNINSANADEDNHNKRMIVVELFTSQGCSSCPPADRVFSEIINKNDDVIGLGMHVDYWDYLGWRDKMASPIFTKRQAQYNSVIPSKYRLVTPQTIIDGARQVAGGTGLSPSRIKRFIRWAREEQKDQASLQISRQGRKLMVKLSNHNNALGAAKVQIVYFKPEVNTAILGGENSGRNIKYSNVAHNMKTIRQWDGNSDLQFSYTLENDNPLAVIVQPVKLGQIFVARKLP